MLDAAQGSALKEQGMQMAIDFAGDWPEEVILELRAWLAVQKAIGLTNISIEQFRSQAKSQPDSHKCWGSLPRMACKAGLLAPMLEFGSIYQALVRKNLIRCVGYCEREKGNGTAGGRVWSAVQ